MRTIKNLVAGFLHLIGVFLASFPFNVRSYVPRLSPVSFFRSSMPLSCSGYDRDELDTPSEKKRICIVGGGFGGLYTALGVNRLIDHAKSEVILIEPKENFVFLPLLYELAVGTASKTEVAPKYSDLLQGSKVKFIQGSVSDIDLLRKVCSVLPPNDESMSSVPFDVLVMSVGIRPRTSLIPGASEHALPFHRLQDAYKLREKLNDLKAAKKGFIRVAVVGGGYSGVEVATNIAESLGSRRSAITIIDRNKSIMSNSPPHNRETSERALAKKGIATLSQTSVKSVHAGGLTLIDETKSEYDFDADLVVLTAGTEQCALVQSLDLPKDPFGRIRTDRSLRALDESGRVFAMGDCASIDSYPLPSTAQVAMQQSTTMAKNLAITIEQLQRATTRAQDDNVSSGSAVSTASTAGNDTLSVEASALGEARASLDKFRFLDLGQMLTLGDTNAAITSLGGLVELSGPLAALGRRVIYAARMPTVTQSAKALVTASAVTTGKLMRSMFSRK